MSHKKQLNLHRDNTNKDWRGERLCPFREFTFGFGGVILTTVEGFMLTLRLPPSDHRRIITTMDSAAAARRVAGRLKDRPVVIWNREEIKRNSKEFDQFFERMMRARFRKDRRAIAALMASRRLKLVHMRPRSGAPLSAVPIKLYCKILTKFRAELFKSGEIAKSV